MITDFQYYGLTTKQIHALTETLIINSHIKKLILQDNWLTVEDTEKISNMLEENSSISVLNMKECRIGEAGTYLPICFYPYHYQIIRIFIQMFKMVSFRSNAFFHSTGAEKLNEALSSSQFLTGLDLSFNSLGDKGLMNLQTGLCEAPNLRVLNISHNGLTEESAETLEKILLENKIIQELDLSWNLFCTPPGK